MFSYLARPSPKTGYVVTRSRPYLLPLIDSVLDAVLYAVIDAVLFRERLTFAKEGARGGGRTRTPCGARLDIIFTRA
jgi:hypothetical protein